ncbi:hypothetical protein BGX23_008601 [Mortierella sp. AD031]|nr:hypothetical protein BGX23_008601 [Mortierella sp. AD031]KAG0217431.1 hypothetical protein BGX33_010616 [Mortierella sp. NVP41]
MSKSVSSFQQNHEGVMLRFSDNTTVHGGVLVGADGAHSGVRQRLFKALQAQGFPSKADTKNMNMGYISLVGTTVPLGPAKYPGLSQPDSVNSYHIGDSSMPYSWVAFTVPGNNICWNVVIQLELADIGNEESRDSDWAPEANMKILKRVRDFKTCAALWGILLTQHPKTESPRSTLRTCFLRPWRTVLMTMLLPKDYREQRFEYIKTQYAHSHTNAKTQFGHTWQERIFRYVILNWLPKPLMFTQIIKDSAYRPQTNFMPQALKRGSAPVIQ